MSYLRLITEGRDPAEIAELAAAVRDTIDTTKQTVLRPLYQDGMTRDERYPLACDILEIPPDERYSQHQAITKIPLAVCVVIAVEEWIEEQQGESNAASAS